MLDELWLAVRDSVTGEPLNPEAITGLTAAQVKLVIEYIESLERVIHANQMHSGRYIDQLRARIVQADKHAERATKLYREKHGHVALLLDAAVAEADGLRNQLQSVIEDAERYRYIRNYEDPPVRCMTIRKGYRSTAPDAKWEEWEEPEGWLMRSHSVLTDSFKTMDEAVDSKRRLAVCKPTGG